jgi:hypothetical protein
MAVAGGQMNAYGKTREVAICRFFRGRETVMIEAQHNYDLAFRAEEMPTLLACIAELPLTEPGPQLPPTCPPTPTQRWQVSLTSHR